MRSIEIVGDDYIGHYEKERTACRGLIVKDDQILMSYEVNTDQWMIPGGGLEDGEDDRECVIREIEEETGVIAEPGECALEINEYYHEWKFASRYFICKVVGTGNRKLTENEMRKGMEPRWITIEEIKKIFSGYEDYRDSDSMRSGLYKREYTALCQLL